jgi:hypothetical protein
MFVSCVAYGVLRLYWSGLSLVLAWSQLHLRSSAAGRGWILDHPLETRLICVRDYLVVISTDYRPRRTISRNAQVSSQIFRIVIGESVVIFFVFVSPPVDVDLRSYPFRAPYFTCCKVPRLFQKSLLKTSVWLGTNELFWDGNVPDYRTQMCRLVLYTLHAPFAFLPCYSALLILDCVHVD